MNPVIPIYAEAWFLVAGVACFALVIATVISICARGKNMPTGAALLWGLVVLCIPLIGAAAWWIVGYRQSRPAPDPLS